MFIITATVIIVIIISILTIIVDVRRYIVQQKITRFRIDKIVMGGGSPGIEAPDTLIQRRATSLISDALQLS